MSRIFAIEDDKDLQGLLIYSLSSFKHEVEVFDSAEALLGVLSDRNKPDIFLLDIMLGGMDGLELLKILKAGRFKNIPVIVLTAKATEMNIVTGLNLGADDYITKPFSVVELSARINTALRHYKKEDVIAMKNLTLNFTSHELFIDGRPVSLTIKEFELLAALLANLNTVLKREELLSSIWGYDYLGETRTLDMHIKTLRSKISNAAVSIETVRGIGFKLCKKDEL